jgi:hypothetical protein
MLPARGADAIDRAIGDALSAGGILCRGSRGAFGVVARNHGIRHEPINLFAGERVRDKIRHIQDANAHHSRLKAWIAGFKGVATRYLPNYLAWHHVIDRNRAAPDHATWIRLACNT